MATGPGELARERRMVVQFPHQLGQADVGDVEDLETGAAVAQVGQIPLGVGGAMQVGAVEDLDPRRLRLVASGRPSTAPVSTTARLPRGASDRRCRRCGRCSP